MMKRNTRARLCSLNATPSVKTPTRKLIQLSATALMIALLYILAFRGSTTVVAAAAAENDLGESTFKTTCAMCHGQDGSGNTDVGKSLKIPDLHSAEVQGKSDEQLSQIITNGKNAMPPFKSSLTDDQIHALVMYVRQLKKK
jgi:mono/diheme cytochrome c family protein